MYSQLDPRWKDIRMGTSSRTIGQDGCLLCCIAWVISETNPVCDPAWLNRWLSRNGGYTNGNRIVFDSFQPLGWKVVEYYDWRKVPADVDKVKQMLHEGATYLEVNATPGRSFTPHWVLAEFYLNDDVYILDPLLPPGDWEVVRLLPRYAAPNEDLARAIYRAVRYERITQKKEDSNGTE